MGGDWRSEHAANEPNKAKSLPQAHDQRIADARSQDSPNIDNK
jgi:hypothetical protein